MVAVELSLILKSRLEGSNVTVFDVPSATDYVAPVDGVDGGVFGPSDLSASLGLRGQPGHPTVRAAI